MNLLLDTHILLWWLADSPRLHRKARSAIQDAGEVWVSAVSAWEIEAKRSRGLLDSPANLGKVLQAQDILTLSLTVAHAVAAARLPFHHRDPFDRMLVAQASMESLVLMTSDKHLEAYSIPMMRV